MKKIICAYMALCIITTAASAAPYRMEYLSSTVHSIATLLDSIAGYGWHNKAKDADETTNNTSGNTSAATQKQPIVNRHISEVAASIAVVKQVAGSQYNGDSMLKVTYYINNGTDTRDCYFSSDSYSTGGRFTYDDLNAGSLVYISIDSDSVVEEYCVVGIINDSTGLPEIDLSGASAEFNPEKIQFTYSYILDCGSRDGNVSVDLANGASVDAPRDSIQYTVEPQRRSTVIHVGDCLAGYVDIAEYDEQLDKTVAYPMLSVAYKGESVFACSFSTPVYVDGNILE